MHKNAGSALKLGHGRSAALCATFEHDVEVFEYAPREIKQAIVGTGAATKEQVQHMVVALLRPRCGARRWMPRTRLLPQLCHAHQHRCQRATGSMRATAAVAGFGNDRFAARHD